MQNGSVHALSAGTGQGSEFIVRLPCLEHAAPSSPSVRPAGTQDAAHRVLVVDDYVDSAESMAVLLQAEGHEVRIAHEGLTAIKMAPDFKPSLVFLDIGLPGMNGFEVARSLRSMPETKDCVLVAMTGYGQAEDHQRSLENGFDRHFVKPVDPLALQELFDSLKNASSAKQRIPDPDQTPQ
jgi:two-component system CheB/CheR fusion protein